MHTIMVMTNTAKNGEKGLLSYFCKCMLIGNSCLCFSAENSYLQKY